LSSTYPHILSKACDNTPHTRYRQWNSKDLYNLVADLLAIDFGDPVVKEEIRRAIVVNAAAQISRRAPSSVYSYHRGKHTQINPTYDYEAGAHIGGSGSSLYHYGVGAHISLSVNGTSFSGYDYDGGHHFSGSVNGGTVQLYDYGEGRHFNYSV
jgi:hypothetical protein